MDYDELLLRLYDSAEGAGLPDVLPAIVEHLGAERAHTLVIAGGAVAEDHGHEIDRARLAMYVEHLSVSDPRLRAASERAGAILEDVSSIDRDAFERSEMFAELTRDHTPYTLFGYLPVPRSDVVFAPAFMRGQRRGPFERREVQRLERLAPHLCRATRLRCVVSGFRSELSDLRRALDLVPEPLAVLDARGYIWCTNAACDAVLKAPSGLTSQRGMVTASHPDDAYELAGALARAALFADARRPGTEASRHGQVPALRVRRDGAGPLWLTLSPLRPNSVLRDAAGARVLLIVHDPERQLRVSPELLRSTFGLTKTEALLAGELARGVTIKDFARGQHVSEHTARTHLKRVLEKTGTHRQADLVRTLLALAPPPRTRRG